MKGSIMFGKQSELLYLQRQATVVESVDTERCRADLWLINKHKQIESRPWTTEQNIDSSHRRFILFFTISHLTSLVLLHASSLHHRHMLYAV